MSVLRDESFYYQYEYKGGTVEMPKEVFWELYYDSKEEIERLHSIIKEVREEIIKDRKKNYGDLGKKAFYCNKTDKLLEILGSDKE